MKLSKTQGLYLIILLLLSINVTIVTRFSRHLKEEANTTVESVDVPNTHLGRFFKDELGLSSEQHQHFRTFRQTYHTESNHLLSEMKTIRESILTELKSTNPKRKKLDDYAQSIGKMHIHLKQLTYDYYLNMQSVLDEEQKKRLAIIFQSMLSEEGNAKTPEHNALHYKSHSHTEEAAQDSCTKENINF